MLAECSLPQTVNSLARNSAGIIYPNLVRMSSVTKHGTSRVAFGFVSPPIAMPSILSFSTFISFIPLATTEFG